MNRQCDGCKFDGEPCSIMVIGECQSREPVEKKVKAK